MLTVCLCLLLSCNAFSWWGDGHKLIAKIAYDRLLPEVKIQVDNYTQLLSHDYPEIQHFLDMAIWPDLIRKQAVDAYTHWHFIDKPYSSDGSPSQIVVDTDNALWAIDQIKTTLTSNKSKPIERARFLSFLVHIVGDLHQPLHTVCRSNKERPTGDVGGNLYLVKDPNNEQRTLSLHSLWDSNFGDFANPLDDLGIEQLAKVITERYPESYFDDRSHNVEATQWADEGYILGVTLVYSTKELQVPSAAYQRESKAIIQQRIALAGYRLANITNQLLSPK